MLCFLHWLFTPQTGTNKHSDGLTGVGRVGGAHTTVKDNPGAGSVGGVGSTRNGYVWIDGFYRRARRVTSGTGGRGPAPPYRGG